MKFNISLIFSDFLFFVEDCKSHGSIVATQPSTQNENLWQVGTTWKLYNFRFTNRKLYSYPKQSEIGLLFNGRLAAVKHLKSLSNSYFSKAQQNNGRFAQRSMTDQFHAICMHVFSLVLIKPLGTHWALVKEKCLKKPHETWWSKSRLNYIFLCAEPFWGRWVNNWFWSRFL